MKPLSELVKEKYNGDRALAAQAADTTRHTLNNWICEGREVEELADGRHVLVSDKTKIFN